MLSFPDGCTSVHVLPSIRTQHFELRSFSRALKGRSRTATFTVSDMDQAIAFQKAALLYLVSFFLRVSSIVLVTCHGSVLADPRSKQEGGDEVGLFGRDRFFFPSRPAL